MIREEAETLVTTSGADTVFAYQRQAADSTTTNIVEKIDTGASGLQVTIETERVRGPSPAVDQITTKQAALSKAEAEGFWFAPPNPSMVC